MKLYSADQRRLELAVPLRMSSWLAWARERSPVSAPGIKSNIGVTFWREASWLSLALLLKISVFNLTLQKSTTTESPAGHLRVQPQAQGTGGGFEGMQTQTEETDVMRQRNW